MRAKLACEKLLPCEVRAAEMLCKLACYGMKCQTGDVAKALGLAKNTTKHYLNSAMNKTGYFNRIKFVLAWRCELFQIGLRNLGIR